MLSTIGDVAKSATSGSASTMKGVIDVGNVTPISASMVGVACAAGTVAEACVSTVSSKSAVESAQDVSMEIARTGAKRAKSHQQFQQLSPIRTWKPTTFAWSSQRGSSNPSLGNARQLSSSRL